MKGDLFFSLLSLAFIDCILQLVIVYKTQAVQFAFDVVKRKYTIFPEVLGKYLNFNLNSVVLMHLLLNREHVQVAMCSRGYKSKHCCWELCLVWTFENVDTLALADCWSPSSWVACCLFCVLGCQLVRDRTGLGRQLWHGPGWQKNGVSFWESSEGDMRSTSLSSTGNSYLLLQISLATLQGNGEN